MEVVSAEDEVNRPLKRFRDARRAFLERHRAKLADNPRMRLPLRSLEKRAQGRRAADARILAAVRERLRRGQELEPGDLP